MEHQNWVLFLSRIWEMSLWAHVVYLIISLYVDDLIFINHDCMIATFKNWMKTKSYNDISRKTGLLFKDWRQDGDGIFVHQHKYAKEQILQKFGMESCNMICNHIIPRCKLTKDERGKTIYITKYKQIVGYLMYLDCH